MTQGLRRFHESRQSHFITFSCYHRESKFKTAEACDLFLECLENVRQRFSLRVYGYVIMPEHVHLLVSEPGRGCLADAMHSLKLSFTKRLQNYPGAQKTKSFWQKRYHDRNVRNAEEFSTKLRYLHRNPVKRGLVPGPADWKWSSFRHYALRERGRVEIESEWAAADRDVAAGRSLGRTFLSPG